MRLEMISETGASLMIEVPKSPWAAPPMKATYLKGRKTRQIELLPNLRDIGFGRLEAEHLDHRVAGRKPDDRERAKRHPQGDRYCTQEAPG